LHIFSLKYWLVFYSPTPYHDIHNESQMVITIIQRGNVIQLNIFNICSSIIYLFICCKGYTFAVMQKGRG